MPKPTINVGDRFGMVVVQSRGENSEQGKSRWVCSCDCGQTALLLAARLKSHPNPSCGCDIKARRPLWGRTHGHSADGKVSRTYSIWNRMRQRCENPTAVGYADYGGKGVTVCKRWQEFENFLADMGECPDGYSIERERVNEGYGPDNCKWADKETQANNRRGQKFYLVDEKWLTHAQAGRYWGLKFKASKKRLEGLPMRVNPE